MEQVEITKEFLLSELSKVKPGIAKKAIVEQTSHFMFLDKVLASFSDQIAVILPFDTGMTFSVKADEFFKIISGIEEDDLTLSLEEEKITIETANTRAGMSTIVDDKSKVENEVALLQEEMKEGKWNKLPDDFLKGIELCVFSAAGDLSMGVLACISVDGKDIISTDSIRASWYTMNKSVTPFLIPARDAEQLLDYTDLSKICVTDNWIHFQNDDGLSFSVKRIIGKYRDVRKVFDVKGEVINLPGNLRNVLKSIEFIAEGDTTINKIIQVKIEKGKIICKAQKEVGWIEKKLDYAYKGKPISFYINPIFLNQILEKSTKMIFGKDRVLFETDNFRHFYILPGEE